MWISRREYDAALRAAYRRGEFAGEARTYKRMSQRRRERTRELLERSDRIHADAVCRLREIARA